MNIKQPIDGRTKSVCRFCGCPINQKWRLWLHANLPKPSVVWTMTPHQPVPIDRGIAIVTEEEEVAILVTCPRCQYPSTRDLGRITPNHDSRFATLQVIHYIILCHHCHGKFADVRNPQGAAWVTEEVPA